MDFQLVVNNQGFGIMYNDKMAVPLMHKTKEGAVGELVYFETANTNFPKHRQFLDHVLTIEQIECVKQELLKQEL